VIYGLAKQTIPRRIIMAGKNITFTLKLDKDIRSLLKDFCESRGLLMNSFVERAIMDEIEKEELKEDLAAIQHYEKFERDSTIPLKKVSEELNFYPKKKK
jgi:hypothetical protein